MSKEVILVIDDEESVRESIFDTLESDGYQIYFADNGKEGLAALKACQPILMILDVIMPVMGGIDFLEQIQLSPSDPYSVIVLTGYGFDEEVKQCFHLGVSAFIRKPFNIYELRGLVSHVIALKKMQLDFENSLLERTAALMTVNQQLANEIEERKKTEQTLRVVQRQNELILNSAGEGILGLDKHGCFTFANPAALTMLQMNKDELIANSAHTLVHHSQASSQPYAFEECPMIQTIHTGVIHQGDNEIFYRKDRSFFPVEYISAPIMDENDSIDGAVVVFKDISERKKTEEYIQNSLNEKELLISEIHHRVKNNMQIISSLLNMQSKIIKDPAALELLKEVQNRIKAMSLIHNKLYRSKNMSSVNFKSYMLSLANELFKSYGVTNDGVSLKTDLKNISLGIDLAIPCGLIINELISNALKYAFPHERKGEIILTLHEIESGKYQLIVSDNGVGLPNDFDLKRQDSLGISIVLTLVKQINGKIEFRSNQGTSVALQF